MKSKKAMDNLIWMIVILVPMLIAVGLLLIFNTDILNVANSAVNLNCKHITGGWLGKCIPPSESCEQMYGGVDYSIYPTTPDDVCYNKKDDKTKDYTCCVLDENPANKIQVYSVNNNGQTLLFSKKNDFDLSLEGKNEIDVSFKVVDNSKDYLVYDKIVFEVVPGLLENSCIKTKQSFDCTSKNCIFPIPGGAGDNIQYKPLKLSKGLCTVEISGYFGKNLIFFKHSTLNIYD